MQHATCHATCHLPYKCTAHMPLVTCPPRRLPCTTGRARAPCSPTAPSGAPGSTPSVACGSGACAGSAGTAGNCTAVAVAIAIAIALRAGDVQLGRDGMCRFGVDKLFRCDLVLCVIMDDLVLCVIMAVHSSSHAPVWHAPCGGSEWGHEQRSTIHGTLAGARCVREPAELRRREVREERQEAAASQATYQRTTRHVAVWQQATRPRGRRASARAERSESARRQPAPGRRIPAAIAVGYPLQTAGCGPAATSLQTQRTACCVLRRHTRR
jgi:hypothetical protein